MRTETSLVILVLSALSILGVSQAAPLPQESPCGHLLDLGQPSPGQQTSTWLANADGTILAGRTSAPGGALTLRWTEQGGYEVLPAVPGFDDVRPTAIDGEGDTLVGTAFGPTTDTGRPYRWDESSGWQALNWPFAASAGWGRARDVSEDGTIVAGELMIDVTGFGEFFEQALVWFGAGAPAIVVPPGFDHSRALALSADGSTLAGVAFDIDFSPFGTPITQNTRAFVWTATGGFTLIGAPGDGLEPVDLSADGGVLLGNKPQDAHLWTSAAGLQSLGIGYAVDLDADGTTFVGSALVSGALRAYRWTSATGPEILGGPAGGRSLGYFVSDDGSTVVGVTRNAAFEEAVFRWTEGAGWEDIGLAVVADPFQPFNISDDGSVIAGRTKFGATRGMRWEANSFGGSFCQGASNSVGQVAALRACGCDQVAENDLVLFATRMPPNTFGLFVSSRIQAPPTMIANSVGVLCLGAPYGRFAGPGQILNTGAPGSDGTGSFSLPVDLTQVPTATGFASVQAGETWNFQAWYRDTGLGTGPSNLTEAVELTFL